MNYIFVIKTKINTHRTQFSIKELNELAVSDNSAVLIDTENGRFTVDSFMELSEDCIDSKEKINRYEDGTVCCIVAYVVEKFERVPFLSINRILVASEVSIK